MFTCSRVTKFIEAENFTLSSLGLNLLDFLHFGDLQEKIYLSLGLRHDHIKRVLLHCWVQ